MGRYAENYPHTLSYFKVDLQPTSRYHLIAAQVGHSTSTKELLAFHHEILFSWETYILTTIVDQHAQSLIRH